MKAIITTIVILVGAIGSTHAYPIDPRPLRKLIMESEFIIVGHVLEIQTVESKKEQDYSSVIARIRIMEVLQGAISESVIDVPFNPYFICPAPARYEAGTDVLVFLNKKKGTYYTHALSYGAKTLSPEYLEVYRDRIREMQDIMTITDGYRKFFETVEWLVKCAENPATRWEGTFELSPESDFMSFYASSELPPFQSMLSAEQRARLKKALFDTSLPGYADMGLIDLVYRSNEAEVHGFLLRSLKNLSGEQMWFGNFYMERLLQRKSSPQMEALVECFSKKFYDRAEERELKNIIQEFVALAED